MPDRPGRRPLSSAQAGVWFAQQLDPANPIFNCARAIELTGPVDLDRLGDAIAAVLAATDVLHARLDAGAGGAAPSQRLADLPCVPVERIDVGGEPDPWAVALAAMREDLARATPLTGDGLIREVLFVAGPERVFWYQRIHHVLIDGVAFAMLVRRVAQLYGALADGRDPGPGFAALDDVLDDERAYRVSPAFEEDRAFWAARLGDGPEIMSLADRAAPPAHRFTRVSGTLGAAASRGLADHARAAGASWPELVIATGAAYLHRMTGARDVVLGLPSMARVGTAAARVPTTVVNVLPLRLALDPATHLGTLLAATAEELHAVRAHQRYRSEDLRRDLGLVGAGHRLFGPQVNVKAFDDEPRFAGLRARTHHLAAGPVDDLELIVYGNRNGGGLGLDVDANPDLYDDATVAAHHARLIAVLERIAADGLDTALGDLDVLAPGERRRVLHDFNATAHPVSDTTLPELIATTAAAHPDAIAVRATGVEVSYAELHARARALAATLRQRGARPGALIAVALERSIDLLVAIVGVLEAGAAYLPLDLDHPPARLEAMLADARPVALIADGHAAAAVPSGTHVLSLGAGAPPAERAARPVGADPAYVIYTSGSTGAPKGVVVSHAAIVNRLAWMQDAYPLAIGDRVLQKTPIGFDVSVWELLWPLTVGATVVMAPSGAHRDPRALARLIADERIAVAHFVPSMLAAFLADPAADGCATALRQLVCSGEALSGVFVTRAREVFGAVPVANLYGPTEATIDVTAWDCDPGAPSSAPVPIGRPVWNTRTYVLDGTRRPVPVGVTGELYLAGAQLASGYLNRPELTAERFVPDPFGASKALMYRTGDLARWREDGALEFLGRADDQIKVRGVRVEPGEIEAVLARRDDVAQAAVAARPDATGQPRLTAYVVPEPSAATAPEPDALRAALAAELPDAMVPAAIVVLDALPVTANGKLDRAALPEPELRAVGEPPRTPLEELVCTTMAELLELPGAGREDNFFDLGGHSLLAVRLAHRVGEATGTQVTIADVFAAATPATLADRLQRADGPGGDALGGLLALRPRGAQPALFCVHPAGGIAWCYAGLLRALDADRPVHALQARGLDGAAAPAASIAEMAADYVARIRAVQSQGPYHLLGWSIGGVIAQAMACELQHAGAETGACVLLDAYPSDQWRDLPAPDEATALHALLYMGGLDETSLGDAPPTRAAVLNVLHERGSALGALGGQTLSAIVDIVSNNARLTREHLHERFDGDALFFTAAAPRDQAWLTRTAWAPHITGAIVNHDLNCTHPAMVRPERLAEIAAVLGPYLAAVEETRRLAAR